MAENPLGNVARALRRQTNIQPMLAALPSDDFKGIKLGGVIIGADLMAQKIVRFVNYDDYRALHEVSIASFGQQMAADHVRDNFLRIELMGNPAHANAKQLGVTAYEVVDLLSQLGVSRFEDALEGGGCAYPVYSRKQ